MLFSVEPTAHYFKLPKQHRLVFEKYLVRRKFESIPEMGNIKHNGISVLGGYFVIRDSELEALVNNNSTELGVSVVEIPLFEKDNRHYPTLTIKFKRVEQK